MKRYAVAYKRFPEDNSVFYKGNAICLFGQDEATVQHFKEHYIAIIPEKKTSWDTYRALEKMIEKVEGLPIQIVFTNYAPTIWKIKPQCKCPIGYHKMFIECRGY